MCQYCHLYLKNENSPTLEQELDYFVKDSQFSQVVVALSGGKDSLTTLFLAVKMGLTPRCLMYQNGFIPAEIVERSRQHCADLNVPLDIVEIPLYETFLQEYEVTPTKVEARTGADFCKSCSKHLDGIARAYMKQHQAHWLLFGNKTYATLSPYLSAMQRHISDAEHAYYSVNFLYLLKVTATQQKEILNAMNWQDPGLTGYTSNCLIPGFVHQARQEKLGFHPEQSYIAMEKRSGSYTQSQAEAVLASTQPEASTYPATEIKAYYQKQGWPWPKNPQKEV